MKPKRLNAILDWVSGLIMLALVYVAEYSPNQLQLKIIIPILAFIAGYMFYRGIENDK